MVEKVSLNCKHCKKEYFVYPSKSSTSKFCSATCKKQHNNKNKVKKTCEGCKVEFSYPASKPKKFCSRKCYLEKVEKEKITLSCIACGKEYIRHKHRKTKFCSKKCQFESQSNGLKKIPSNGRMGYRKDLPNTFFFKSSLEADYARYCKEINKPYVYEHKTFTVKINDKEKIYTPDFYHPDEDKYVELKAIRRDRKFNSNLLAADILKENGLNIEVLLMKDFYRLLKQKGYYWSIDNIENKNYLGTKHLIYK